MTIAELDAKALPHWRCECGFRVFSPELELAEQVCFCGKGEGCWWLENGHLLAWMDELERKGQQ